MFSKRSTRSNYNGIFNSANNRVGYACTFSQCNTQKHTTKGRTNCRGPANYASYYRLLVVCFINGSAT
jgi:hypothetical protein